MKHRSDVQYQHRKTLRTLVQFRIRRNSLFDISIYSRHFTTVNLCRAIISFGRLHSICFCVNFVFKFLISGKLNERKIERK